MICFFIFPDALSDTSKLTKIRIHVLHVSALNLLLDCSVGQGRLDAIILTSTSRKKQRLISGRPNENIFFQASRLWWERLRLKSRHVWWRSDQITAGRYTGTRDDLCGIEKEKYSFFFSYGNYSFWNAKQHISTKRCLISFLIFAVEVNRSVQTL